MFKRPDDLPEYYHLYGIPAVGSMAFYTAGLMSGHVPEINSAAAKPLRSAMHRWHWGISVAENRKPRRGLWTGR